MLCDLIRRDVLALRDAALDGCLGDSGGNRGCHAGIERVGDHMVFLEVLLINQGSDGIGRSNLHLLVDILRTHIQRTAEDAGECQEVVDLIREIRAARADHARTCLLGKIRQDLGCRVCHRHDDGVLVHRADHFLREQTGFGNADEDVCALDDIRELPLLMILVRDGGNLVLIGVHALCTALENRTRGVAEQNILCAHALQETRDGHARRACAVHDDLHVLELLADQAQRIDKRGGNHNGRAMLIIVENRNIHAFLQRTFDIEALRSLDVLQIDAAKARRHELDGLHNLIDALRVEADGDSVHTRKPLEQDGFALHDRKACACADIAKTEHRRSVGHDSDHISLRRIVINLAEILLDFQTGRRNTRRIGQGKILRRSQRHFAGNLQLARMLLVQR